MTMRPLHTALPAVPPVKPISVRGRSTRELLATDPKRTAHIVTDEQFDHILKLVADGTKVSAALAAAKVTRTGFEDVLRSNDAARARYDEAKLYALYKDVDLETVEAICVEIASGKRHLDAVLEDRMIASHTWWKLVLKDPVARELYEDARKIQCEQQADELVQISADDTRDVITTQRDSGVIEHKANNAAVQRDRLKSDNMKWLMARLHHERFGDKQKIDLNATVTIDYASRLEAARSRKQAAIIKPKGASE